MNTDAEIVTVRPKETVHTIQNIPNFVGISGETAGAQGISMNMVAIPPLAESEPHVHSGYETAIYVIKGVVQTKYGPRLEKSVTNKEGDFVFVPAGLPHQSINVSDSETALAIVARNDPNEQESVEVYPLNSTTQD